MAKKLYKMDKVLCRKLAKKIKNRRIDLDINQEEVSFRAKIAQATYSLIENGRLDFSVTVANNIAKSLGITIQELFDFTDL